MEEKDAQSNKNKQKNKKGNGKRPRGQAQLIRPMTLNIRGFSPGREAINSAQAGSVKGNRKKGGPLTRTRNKINILKLIERQALREDRESYVLWRRPIGVLHYALLEAIQMLKYIFLELLQYSNVLAMLWPVVLYVSFFYYAEGVHMMRVQRVVNKFFWYLKWFVLGVLSTMGYLTGLHNFYVYMGPHISAVTQAAYKCGGLNFPEPPYPYRIMCPLKIHPVWAVSLQNIIYKVLVESLLWGAGTAIGELPTYFMTRAASVSTCDPEDEEQIEEWETFQKRISKRAVSLLQSIQDRSKILVEKFVKKAGFFSILLFASIPNPIFNWAGVVCGHFMLPFWAFFGATFIGKTFLKMMTQLIFVIVVSSNELINESVTYLQSVPHIGRTLQDLAIHFFAELRDVINNKEHAYSEKNILDILCEIIGMLLSLYFGISMIHSWAQKYHKRIHKTEA